MAGKPFMPVEDLIRHTIPDPDYADGDNPGWFSGHWNPDSSELMIRYEPDHGADPAYRLTEHVFRYGAQARVGGPSLGQAAYEAYCHQTGWKSRFNGDALPEWKDQDPEIQACWVAAADAVRVAL